jgi:hypothetical protein
MTNVKNYTDEDLIDLMKGLDSFVYVPKGVHYIAVRSNEDAPDSYDDKIYMFIHETCIGVMPCTTNSGTYGLKSFKKWNKKGTAVIKSNEIYYDVYQKSDGGKIRHHNGKGECLRQIGKMKYYRDNNLDDKIDETGPIYYANNSTNIHCNSYKYRSGILSWLIGRWGTGCIVVNNLTKYYKLLIGKTPFNKKLTFTLLKEI